MTRRLLFAWIAILGTVHGVNLYVFPQHLFWTHSWIDLPFHFFGGVGVGFLALWFLVWAGIIPISEHTSWLAERMKRAFPEGMPWWLSFGAVVAVSDLFIWGWEVFEAELVFYFSKPLPTGYILDTNIDIMLGYVGVCTAWFVFYKVEYMTWRRAAPARPQQANTKQH